MLTPDDYWYFTDRALRGLTDIVRELGDDLANRRPPLPGANSPYALLTHCLGVVDAWVGGFVAGRPIDRDRDAEFVAEGSVTALLTRAEETRGRFLLDLRAADPSAPLKAQPPADFEGPDRGLDAGAALQHVYEELAQHHGQMQQMRDLLLAVERGDLVVAR
ncbi:DinB family protein [Herbiconiux moechotypicola]|uniref:DinB-like domain-containing protein n=1 Tax=Herbiconiux moechotypicola TaxID=637393 RepID=A0ABN3DE26_9MICO|nr:DinB family protein [Herbiconiux moechotypicola]MCS5729253.1 DinB family protein [Herbiconiux moechotypicola]